MLGGGDVLGLVGREILKRIGRRVEGLDRIAHQFLLRGACGRSVGYPRASQFRPPCVMRHDRRRRYLRRTMHTQTQRSILAASRNCVRDTGPGSHSATLL